MFGIAPLKRRVAQLERQVARLEEAVAAVAPEVVRHIQDREERAAYAQSVKDCH